MPEEAPETAEYPITNQDAMPAHSPDLLTLLDQKSRMVKSEINCVQIGTVQSFDPTTQTASVSINLSRIVDGSVKAYPVLAQVPVIILQGGLGALTFPIASGDPCLVFFCDRNIDSWVTTGLVSAPESERVHDLSDGIALVGIRSPLNLITSYLSNGVHAWHGASKDAALSLEEGVKAQLEHKTAKLTLIDQQEASLIQGENGVKVEDKIAIHVGIATLKAALDALCSAISGGGVDSSTHRIDASTQAAIAAAQALIDGVLK